MKKRKRILKVIIWIILSLFLLFTIYLVVPSYPHFLFRQKFEYKNFTFYTDNKFPKDFIEVAKDIEYRIQNLEIYDSTFQPDIFICNSKDLYSCFAFWVRLNTNSQGFNLSLMDNTFINLYRVNTLNFYHDQRLKYTHLNGNIAQVISHELVHNLDSKFTGFWNYKDKPQWKKEGYAEYGSTIAYIEQDSTFDLHERASFYFKDDLFNSPYHSKEYYKAQIMVEYLFTERGYNLAMLNDSLIRKDKVFSELREWYYKNGKYKADSIKKFESAGIYKAIINSQYLYCLPNSLNIR